MKTKILLVAFLASFRLLAGVVVVDGKVVWRNLNGTIDQSTHAHPIRVVDGTNVPLWLEWQWEDNAHRGSEPLPAWEFVRGEVTQATAKDGMLVRRQGSQKLIFVKEAPWAYTDGDGFAEWLIYDDVYRYKSVLGSTKTVDSYRFGKLPSGEALSRTAAQTAEANERQAEAAKKSAGEVAKARAEAKAKRQAELDAAVAKFKAEQAAKEAGK